MISMVVTVFIYNDKAKNDYNHTTVNLTVEFYSAKLRLSFRHCQRCVYVILQLSSNTRYIDNELGTSFAAVDSMNAKQTKIVYVKKISLKALNILIGAGFKVVIV